MITELKTRILTQACSRFPIVCYNKIAVEVAPSLMPLSSNEAVFIPQLISSCLCHLLSSLVKDVLVDSYHKALGHNYFIEFRCIYLAFL